MRTVLEEICAAKREHISTQARLVPQAVLEKQCTLAPPTRGFAKALQAAVTTEKCALIAEIKKASPSKGIIRAHFHPAQHAKAYEEGGATCLSVLTDAPYFQGDDAYLIEARSACSLPILRKDFILDAYQVYESRALGADAILLIMAALTDAQAAKLESLAASLGLDVLVEVHDEDEAKRALALHSPLLGINNRNLKTLKVDTSTALRVASLAPPSKLVIAESGLSTYADIQTYRTKGIHAFLVGESLMQQADITLATKNLLGA